MNTITLPTGTITDDTLVSGTVQMRQNLISAELETDTFTFHAYSVRAIDPWLYLADKDGNLITTDDDKYILVKNSAPDPTIDSYYGESAMYTFDGELIGKYYIQSVERVTPKLYYFTCMSAIGLLENRMHYGGIYPPEIGEHTYAGEILEDIMQDVPYTVTEEIEDEEIRGWLPIDTARQNLMHLLFALGAIVVRGEQGEISIKYPDSGQPIQINQSDIAVGGSVTAIRTATEIQVTEHGYFADDGERLVTLFDNTDFANPADHELITFSGPHYDLYSPDSLLTIHEEHPNYAVVSGVGKLRGRPYSHSTRVISEETGLDVAENVIAVENETLVSLINATNVLKRLKNFYSVTHEATFGLYFNGQEPGKQYAFTDPFGDNRTGFIKSMDITLSKVLKAETVFMEDFVTGPFGASINQYTLITQSGTWTIPQGTTTLDIVMSGGGQGGYGGEDGEDGDDGQHGISPIDGPQTWSRDGISGAGGFGGFGGYGGHAGKIASVRIPTVTPGTVLTITIGEGGAGGSHYGYDGDPDDGIGEEGTATTVTIDGTTYSTASGQVLDSGYTNPLSGEVFNLSGDDGAEGGKGGSGWADNHSWSNESAEDVTYMGTTFSGGQNGNDAVSDGIFQGWEWWNRAEAGGGSGAAAGRSGLPGGSGVSERLHMRGGAGADGVNAVAPPAQSLPGNGGLGGNGGSGGGGGGGITADWTTDGDEPRWNTSDLLVGEGGTGGLGSSGGKGGDGWVLFFYRTA